MPDKEKPKTSGNRRIPWIIILIVICIYLAIAVPSLIPWRGKSYCMMAESDAYNIAETIDDYFAISEHTTLPTISGDSVYLGYTLSSEWIITQNTATVSRDPDNSIRIVVQDGSGRCPDDYQERFPEWESGRYTLKISKKYDHR